MAQRETYLTPEGLAKLYGELEHLRSTRRYEVAQRIQEATAEIGGPVDNPEYDEAKREQAFVEGRVLTVEAMIKNAIIVPADSKGCSMVQVGSRVTTRYEHGKEEHYTIVGSAEADPAQGKISNESPVGKALMGKRKGKLVEVRIPAGAIKLKILNIE